MNAHLFFPLTLERVCLELNNTLCIKNISVSIESNGISAIVGSNGAGKTLLLKLCAGLLTATQGKIHWQQQPVPPQITLVPQKPVLLNRSVEENIRLPLEKNKIADAKEHCENALRWAKIETLAKKPAATLSTGEKQLVALARAKALDPSVLLLDEPSANLDPTRRKQIDALIKNMSENNCKIIFTSHHMSQVSNLAHNVLLLQQGSLIDLLSINDFIKFSEKSDMGLSL